MIVANLTLILYFVKICYLYYFFKYIKIIYTIKGDVWLIKMLFSFKYFKQNL